MHEAKAFQVTKDGDRVTSGSGKGHWERRHDSEGGHAVLTRVTRVRPLTKVTCEKRLISVFI